MVQRIYRKGDLRAVTGLGPTEIYKRVVAGEFPPPIQLGPRAVGWLETDIAKWQAEIIAAPKMPLPPPPGLKRKTRKGATAMTEVA